MAADLPLELLLVLPTRVAAVGPGHKISFPLMDVALSMAFSDGRVTAAGLLLRLQI